MGSSDPLQNLGQISWTGGLANANPAKTWDSYAELRKEIVSLFLDTPSLYDRVVRRASESTFVVEYKYPRVYEYGGLAQKRHQRRYGSFAKAMRRFNYLLATRLELHAAYILSVPIDLAHYREKARQAGAICLDCGSHNWKFDGKEHDGA